MQTTGIVRHIDGLGRIVLPKSVLRSLSIKDTDPLEIHVEGDTIGLKRYDKGITLTDQMIRIRDSLKGDITSAIRSFNGDETQVQSIVSNLNEAIKTMSEFDKPAPLHL